MRYQDLKNGIRDHLDSAADDFFMVGHFLRKISEDALFLEDGYKNIWDFAKGEYGLSASSASRFMAINARFSIDGGEHMAEKYIGMGVSKLQEMLGLPDEELEKVTQEATVREIRAMKKAQEEPKSFFGSPKTEKEEHPYTYIPGCSDGRYDCFSCCRECAIRQEPRQCRTAPLGNPFPCTRIDNEGWKRNIAHSLYKDECQLLHLELAPVREGDKEPEPCCLHCGHKTCFPRCDVAKKQDEEERKKAQEEERQRQREAEARRPEPSERDVKAFYDWIGIKTTDYIDAGELRERYRNGGGGGSGPLKDFQGSAMGIRINHKREITWVQLTKRLMEIQEAEARKTDFLERSKGAQKSVRGLIRQQEEKREREATEKRERVQEQTAPIGSDIIDADFQEIEDGPQEAMARETEGALCDTCEHDGECAGRKTHEDGCLGYEEKGRIEETRDRASGPVVERYAQLHVRLYLNDARRELKAYEEVAAEGDGLPTDTIRKKYILVDALALLLDRICQEEEA